MTHVLISDFNQYTVNTPPVPNREVINPSTLYFEPLYALFISYSLYIVYYIPIQKFEFTSLESHSQMNYVVINKYKK